MNDNHETIKDIRKDAEARFREMVEAWMQRRSAFQTTVGAMHAFNTLFDRIEAAHKRELQDALDCGGIVGATRERESADANIADLQSRIKLWTDRSAELVKKCDELYADARKSERGDCAKLREAVGYILKYADSVACRDHDEHTRHYIDQIRKWAQSALAAPPRNCDVGTAEEQAARMDKFCNSHGHGLDGHGTSYACENCKFISIDRCELAWAQMPYESEATK